MGRLLANRLRSLPQTKLRIGWFGYWMATSPLETVGEELEDLLTQAASFEAGLTPALVSVISWIGGAVAPSRLVELAGHAEREALFHCETLLTGARHCEQDLAREAAEPIPDCGRGRRLTLGERKNLARRIGRADIDKLVRDPHPQVIEQLLVNPRLKEADLVRLTTHRPSHAGSVAHLYREGRWLTSHRVRNSLLQNPTMALWQTVPLLWLCTRPELSHVALAPHLPTSLRTAARTRLARCPPLRSGITSLALH